MLWTSIVCVIVVGQDGTKKMTNKTDVSNSKKCFALNPKGFHGLADNLNNGGLQTVSADKASVTAN